MPEEEVQDQKPVEEQIVEVEAKTDEKGLQKAGEAAEESATGAMEEPGSTIGVKDEPESTIGVKGEPESTIGVEDEPESTIGTKEEPEPTTGINEEQNTTIATRKGIISDPSFLPESNNPEETRKQV